MLLSPTKTKAHRERENVRLPNVFLGLDGNHLSRVDGSQLDGNSAQRLLILHLGFFTFDGNHLRNFHRRHVSLGLSNVFLGFDGKHPGFWQRRSAPNSSLPSSSSSFLSVSRMLPSFKPPNIFTQLTSLAKVALVPYKRRSF
ncbi:hypothetical protein I3842_03G251200 [Carya illinoinensis]|uniref:Uncharacterized protein n=1 Tax=Carya illinoinensis TaxID=32201 RepID=A0A922FKW8_CARIL|nr:hypothetical protein I3842_03G251200 [Carya illinoinensis]KAG6724260.1 hypothetical protein I3842_03G251200 [Carya illinoinensis]KAG6724261.1 hypothetical protein I3842_03G251200 [Carya illinoinensis]